MNRTVQTSHESKTSQTLRTSQKGSLYLTVISAPDAEKREEVARHLQYWPYVKFFKYQGDRHLLCCFCLGEAKDGYQLKQLYERSRQLVLLCLRQYDVTITHWKPLPEGFKLFNTNKLVIRTDETLKPFIIYMGESMSGDAVNRDRIAQEKDRMLSQARSSNREPTLIIPHPSSIGRPKVLQIWNKNFLSIFSKIFKKF